MHFFLGTGGFAATTTPAKPQSCHADFNTATSVANQKYRYMKTSLHPDGRVANPRDTKRYRCGLRLALGVNPLFSLCLDISDSRH
jgi:hypothetical protein